MQLGMKQRDGMQIHRVGITHIERRSQSELSAHAHGEYPTMHENHNTATARGKLQDWLDPRIAHRVTMHGRKKTDALKSGCQGVFHTSERVRRQRIQHEISVKSLREARNRGGYGRLVARNTRNHGRAGDTVSVELARPKLGQIPWIGWRSFPTEDPGHRYGRLRPQRWILLLRCQRAKKMVRK